MKKKALKKELKELRSANELYKQRLKENSREFLYYKQIADSALITIDDLQEEIEEITEALITEDQAWQDGYDCAWKNAQSITEYAHRRRVWYKLWL